MDVGALTLTCKIAMEKHELKPDHHNIGDLMGALVEEGEHVAAQFLGMKLAERAEMTRSIFVNSFFKNVFDGSFQEDIKEFPVPGKTQKEELTFRQLQIEIGKWAKANFADNTSYITGQILGPIAPLLGMGEELGELHHAVLKRHQAIRGFDDDTKYKDARDDALADLLVYMCDFASREGIDLLAVFNRTWEKVVSKRNWKTNPQEG